MREKPRYAEGEAYLVVKGVPARYNGEWVLRLERVVTRKPAVESDQVALLLQLKLPVALFEKPLLSARVSVADGDVPKLEFTSETLTELQNVIRGAAGLDVELRVVPPGERE